MKKTFTFMFAAMLLFACETKKGAEENQSEAQTPPPSTETGVNQWTEAQKDLVKRNNGHKRMPGDPVTGNR